MHPYRDSISAERERETARPNRDARREIVALVVALVAGVGVAAQPDGPADRAIGLAVIAATSVALSRLLRDASRLLDGRDVRT